MLISYQAGPPISNGPSQVSQPGNHFARQHRQPRSLPPPDELAARIEEARTTAKLLSQTVQSTPSTEIPNNDLIKEFADRASSASRSIQGYIHSTNPSPDEDTLLTLIETNDQLSVAMSKHQRALLQARRTLSNSPPVNAPSQADRVNYPAPQGPPPGAMGALKAQDHVYPPPVSPPQRAQDHVYVPPPNPPPQRAPPVQQQQEPYQQRDPPSDYQVPDNPFADEAYQQAPPKQPYGLFNRPNQGAPPSGLDQHPSQTEAPQIRQESQMPSFQSTPSYAYRQNFAANNVTMHGATPPPGQDNTHAVQQQMANMRA
jgi:GAT domain